MKSTNNNLKNDVISSSSDNSLNNSFFIDAGVTKSKDQAFKIRCEAAVTSTGLTKEQFYLKSNISRQRWYYFSWGLEPFPTYLKVRLCDLFGKSFRDLFLEEKNG